MGANRSAVARELDDLDMTETALGQVALTLAETLDGGAGMATAAVARELRATLDVLKRGDDGSDALAVFLTDLRSPVRHPED